MKKLLSLFFPFFVFFSCNMDISVPDVSQMNGGNVRLVLGGLQRSVTDGKKMAELSKADYVRVRFVIDGTEIVCHKGKGLDISGEMLTVSDIKSGFYESIEVDIMDKLCTYTAVAKSVTLSATAPNALNASIEKVTPHILVKAAIGIGSDTAFFAFPDIADLSLGFLINSTPTITIPSFDLQYSYFDKWGCMFYRNNPGAATTFAQLKGDFYSRTIQRNISSNDSNISTSNGLYLDRSKNLLYSVKTSFSGGNPELKSWKIKWDEIEGTDGIEIEDFNNANLSCKQICVDNGEVYAIMSETTATPAASAPNTIKLMKFTINGDKARLERTQNLGKCASPPNMTVLDIADGKLFTFIETDDEEGGVGSVLPQSSFKIFVLNAKNLKVIDQVKLDTQSATIQKMLGVRESKVYFGVFGGGGSTADDYVGVYDIEKKSFGKVDSEALVAAMQKLKPSVSPVTINYR
jgi:lipoprotein